MANNKGIIGQGLPQTVMNGTEDDSCSRNDWIWRVTDMWELCLRVAF